MIAAIVGRIWPLWAVMASVALSSVAACGGHGMMAGRDASAASDVPGAQEVLVAAEAATVVPPDASATGADTAAPDASTIEAPGGCEAVRFEGTLNGQSFADALRAMRTGGPGARTVVLRGARDTKGLECFADLIASFQIFQCGGALHVTSMPRGTTQVDTAEDCPVVEIAGLANVGEVYLADASAVTDFSPLVGAARVSIGGYPPLALVAPYVKQAQMLTLSISAASLAPLNDAAASEATFNVRGTTSLADYQPAALTCFSIRLEELSSRDQAAAIAPLCTAARDGRQCPRYRGCFQDPI